MRKGSAVKPAFFIGVPLSGTVASDSDVTAMLTEVFGA